MSSTDPAAESVSSGRAWRFDDFVLDTARYELRRGGDVIVGTIVVDAPTVAVAAEPAPPPRQHIAFCRAADGVRLAYAVAGEGPPLVRAANWMTHLGYDIESPVWRHWVRNLALGHQFIRYDERGCGLSDWEAGDFTFDAWVSDLESVVESLGLERFPLLGVSQGGAVAVALRRQAPGAGHQARPVLGLCQGTSDPGHERRGTASRRTRSRSRPGRLGP